MSGPPPHHFLRRREGQRLGEVTQVLVCLATAPEPVTRSTGVVTGATTIHVGLHCGLSRRPAIDTRRCWFGRAGALTRIDADTFALPDASGRLGVVGTGTSPSSIACVCGASLETPARSRRAGVRTYRPRSRMLGAPRSEPFVNLTRASTLGAIMIFRSYELALEYTPTQAKRLVVAPTGRSMFGCVSGSAIAPPHQLESHSPCPLPAFVAAAAALTSASVNQ